MIKKLVILTFALLAAGSLPAMQQSQKQKQQQSADAKAMADKQQKKDNKKQHTYSNDNPEIVDDLELADLKADMAAIVKAVENNQVNSAHATKSVEKKHERICPTCGYPAALCEVDKDRIAHGNIMLCGCDECGGRVWGCVEPVIKSVAHGAVVAFDYVTQKINDIAKGKS